MCRLLSIILFLILIFASSGKSQEQVDSAYIRPYNHRVILLGYAAKDILSLNVETPHREQHFMPNNPVKVGVGVDLNGTVLSFAYGYGFDFMRDKERGKTESLDFQLHTYGRKMVFDVIVQRYKGFYSEEDFISDDFTLVPDLRIHQYGINGQYILNNRRFSYKSAFNQSERQLRSSGTVLLGGNAFLTKIKSDSTFFYYGRTKLDNVQIGISAGYAYTWVLGRHWQITAALSAGINIGSETVARLYKGYIDVCPTALPRFSVAYTHSTWAIAVSFVSSMTFPVISDEETLGLLSGTARLTYFKRIADIPFLTKLFE